MGADGFECQICGASALVEIEGFSALWRVASDCTPFRQGGKLSVCSACAAMQKIPDEHWFAEIKEIYRKYDIYHQSGGVEQSVFDPMTGQARRRSVMLAQRLTGALNLTASGRLLDFGCGNGAMLAAFSEVRPQWSLFGLELDDRNLARHKQIPGFCGLYTGAPQEVPGHFDLITLSHSLEHTPAPHTVLRCLRERLATGGRLFVQVPNGGQNPFDLVVADHLCHFTAETLMHLVARSGFEVELVETDWVTKEISLLASPAAAPSAGQTRAERPLAVDRVRDRVRWLHAVVEGAGRAAATGRFGLFGTSISATWLFGQLADDVEFFVDEDPARAGRHHMQRPIWRPDEAPTNAAVYLALVPAVAQTVRDRLRGLPLRFHVPPALSLC